MKTPIASLKMSCELAGSADLTWEEREEFYKKEWDKFKDWKSFGFTDSCVQIGIWDDSDSARDGQSEKYIGTGCKQCVYESV